MLGRNRSSGLVLTLKLAVRQDDEYRDEENGHELRNVSSEIENTVSPQLSPRLRGIEESAPYSSLLGMALISMRSSICISPVKTMIARSSSLRNADSRLGPLARSSSGGVTIRPPADGDWAPDAREQIRVGPAACRRRSR